MTSLSDQGEPVPRDAAGLPPTEPEPAALDEPATEPEPIEVASPPQPSGPKWRVVALIADDQREPAADLAAQAAEAAWVVVSSSWHPALLARCEALPRIESIEAPSTPLPGEVRLFACGQAERLPSGYRTQVEDSGATLIEGTLDRIETARLVLKRLEPNGALEPAAEEGPRVANDFLALGTARWFLRDLTIGMGHIDALDHESLTREVLAGARVWQSGDWPAAGNRLRAAFELLTQARERFYPVDAYIIDLCLLDPSTPAADLADPLAARAPVSFLGPALAIERLAAADPEKAVAIKDAVNEGWADVAGGAYAEVDEPLLPLESILWQFRKGHEIYRQHLDDRTVETLARRRFGLYPMLPQIGKRLGFRFAVHMGFDDGRFPVRPEAKRLWESPDGTSLEALTRPPLAANIPSQGLLIPWRLARSMKDDHVATLPLLHWPSPVAGWYLDLRRVASYSPVLARWVTLSDYFHLTDRPYETFQPKLDEYVTPYLAQAATRRDPSPIARRARHARLRARLDGLRWLRALAVSLSASPASSEPAEQESALADVEQTLETGRLADVESVLYQREPTEALALAQAVVGTSSSGRPGYLVLNPLGVPRRAAVVLPDADADLRPEGPLRTAQLTEEGVSAVVDLPAFGYAWVPRQTSFDVPPASIGGLEARGRVLRNESVEVEVDDATGGLRSVKVPGEPTARLGQQLVVTGLVGADGKPAAARMQKDSFAVDYAGPALVQAVSRGELLHPKDGRTLARFQQRYRLWSGRTTLEIKITLSDLDQSWLERAAVEDPWQRYLACRWAWPDQEAALRRTHLLSPELTEAERPETPDALDISTRRQRTALLFGGLAHHRRHGPRMLDTLLIAGREEARTFELGVALDLEHPFHAALDLTGPAYVVPTDAGPPRTGPQGWFFLLDTKSVAVTHVRFADHSGDGRGWGVIFHLLETSGRPGRCRLRLFRPPVWARQIDFQDEVIIDLPMDDDAVLIDLTPHELACVDVTLG
ncbi:MAG TPA: glycosyl hydrolase family 38 [Isosphaeraceae bacterium]|jgi:alpha-mannosidase|nr:glycosyl hydrolase family 38 [Isosphaeraceae bacterium]